MNFSIRTGLVVVSIFAVLLGAVVSKSPLVLELVSNLVRLGICLTLALAIWDSVPARRAFWTGFFVLSFGNLLLASYFGGYQYSSNQLADLMMGAPQQGTLVPYGPSPMFNPPSTPMYLPAVNESFKVIIEEEEASVSEADERPAISETPFNSQQTTPAMPTLGPPSSFPTTGPFYAAPVQINADYYVQRHAIQRALPIMFSLVTGLIGGWLTMWISRQKQAARSENEPISRAPNS
ncbi:hypothetical protein NA78x_001491 [Anatilimnocola sp. NA78]|uniref:hypothetical protein n=1 Tax=Anatilimnocola sp. NA78 TaxID=3415683 RepID=UPI003CE4AA92